MVLPVEGDFEMPTRTTSILGSVIELEVPYVAGQIMGEAEAETLNQTVVQNVGNNVRDHVKTMREQGRSDDEIRAHVSNFAAKYTLGARASGARGPQDEYRAAGEALALIDVQVMAARKGLMLKQVQAKDIAKQLFARDRDSYVKKVEAQRKASARATDDSFLDSFLAKAAE